MMITGNKYIYPKLIGCMAENGDNISSLAKIVGLQYQALSARLRGKKAFELPEIFAIMEHYNRGFDELFSRNETGQKPA